jgi:uncharacterized protein YndB with AHSA1/START domain
MKVSHGTFSIERTYDASVSEVFEAWSDIEVKARWFIGPEGWTLMKRELNFRVGGLEMLQGRLANGRDTLFTACYHEIVAGECIVYVYDMHLTGGVHHSTSLATVELAPSGRRTRLVFTEQVAFLDGTEGPAGTAAREHGTATHLDRIGGVLR